jgi:hypothetical protein
MPKRLFRCTPTMLASFDCPRRYRFAYIDRPSPSKGAPWAHNTVGSAAHLALARWWSLAPQKRTPAAAVALVLGAWNDLGAPPSVRSKTVGGGFKDSAQSGRYRDATATWVERYVTDHFAHAEDPIGVERTVSAPVGSLVVSGRVDRIDEQDGTGELTIVDYKTGRRGVSRDEARGSQALALYVLGARRTLRRPVRRVELHHLPSGEVASFEHTDESLARHLARAEATADDIQAATDTLASGAPADAVFPPNPGPTCSWCDFRQHCPEGQDASQPIDPWAGLAEL